MSEKNNDSNVILKIIVNKETAEIKTNINSFNDKAVVVTTLQTEIKELSKKDKGIAKVILSGLITDCGITQDDFEEVEKVQEVASAISKTITNSTNAEKSGDENDQAN